MLKATAVFIVSVFFLQACASNDKPSYVEKYTAASKITGLTEVPEEFIENFTALFSDLSANDLQKKVESVYAENIYFNDTLNTIEDRLEMLNYLKHTAENLDSYEFKLIDHAQSGDNVYIRWTMDIRFSALGKDIKSHSIGMSHLKFNTEGKIVLHQDYWDSVDAIYQHIPYVGYWVRKVRDKL